MNEHELMQITSALDAVLNPLTPASGRTAAQKLCENIKNSPNSQQIGYAVASKQSAPSHVKYFGLQVILDFIRSNWGKISREIQIQVKNNALTLLESCTSEDVCYVKDGIAHVLTEIAKRVWPQEWPSMIPDLLEKAKLGEMQIEIVELLFLRIAEDVAVLQNISASHRGQDIRHGLSLSLKEIFGFLMNVLGNSLNIYQSLCGTLNESEDKEAKTHLRLCVMTLKTCQGYFEWANTEHIFAGNGSGIDIFFTLMNDEKLKILSTECLILLTQRKGLHADRKYLLGMASEKYVIAMTEIIEKTLQSAVDSENSYLFLKRLGQLLSCLVTQIISAWIPEEESDNEGCIKNLKDFKPFLDLILNFLKLDNFSLSEYLISSFRALLQHRGLSKDEVLLSYVDSLINISSMKLLKCSTIDIPEYAQYDFNDSDEIKSYLASHRANLLQILRGCAVALPNKTMLKILEWVEKEIDLQQNNLVALPLAESFVKWDALKSIAEITIKTGLIFAERQGALDTSIVHTGIQVLQKSLTCRSPDVQLSQCFLSLFGAFFPYLKHWKDTDEIVIAIIHKVCQMFKETADHTKTITTAESLYRRHCLSSIIHICKYYTSLVSQVFDTFRNEIAQLLKIAGHHEIIPLFESMILISGEWKDYKRQKDLIDEIMSFSSSKWVSSTDPRMASASHFAKSIGLLSSSNDMSNLDILQFRNNISFTVALVLALVERSQVPDDNAVLQKGGFINSEGVVIMPSGAHIMSAMPFIVSLVEHFHNLWTDNIKGMMHEDFSRSLDLRDCEKRSMISCNPIVKEPENNEGRLPWQRMQTFIVIVLENCYQILGKAGKCCPMEIYDDPSLFPCFLKSVFTNFQGLPELRIRSFTRQFLYYFLKHCPETLIQKVATPIINGYCNLMNQMLERHWATFTDKEQARIKVFENSNGDLDDSEDMRATDEILQEQLLRTVSRVYLDLLVNLCVNKSPKKKLQRKDEPGDDNEMPDMEMQDVQDSSQMTASAYQLTEMSKLLAPTDCVETLITTSLSCLSWSDTATVFKGVQLAWPLLKLSFTLPFMSDEAAQFIFRSVLRGFQRHGQHDGCSAQFVALSLFVYTSLRPSHPSLYNVLLSVPGVDNSALSVFDQNYSKYQEKKRKTHFRKLLHVLVEQHISQKFRSEEVMDKLPPLFPHKRRPNRNKVNEICSIEDLFNTNEEGA